MIKIIREMSWLVSGMLLLTLVASAQTYHYEAELLTINGNGGNYGTFIGLFGSPSSIEMFFDHSGIIEMTVRARESEYPGIHAKLELSACHVLDTVTVQGVNWMNYKFQKRNCAAPGYWEILFFNDEYDDSVSPPLDLNVFLDFVTFTVIQDTATPPAVRPESLYVSQPVACLQWDSNTEADLAGYKVYWGTSSRHYVQTADVGKVTDYIVTGLIFDVIYYFAATAYDSSGNESGYSNEVAGVLIRKLGETIKLRLSW